MKVTHSPKTINNFPFQKSEAHNNKKKHTVSIAFHLFCQLTVSSSASGSTTAFFVVKHDHHVFGIGRLFVNHHQRRA